MKQARGDLWELGRSADATVITTNGTVKKNGEAVMGRGCAKEAAQRYPDLPRFLGNRIAISGNVLQILKFDRMLITYPVKHQWWQGADLDLICGSALSLIEAADFHKLEKVVMPRPGCGNGGLSWYVVEKALKDVLDDRFISVHYD